MQTIDFENDGRGYHASVQLAAAAAAIDADGDHVVTDTIALILAPTLRRLTTQIIAKAGSTVDVFYSCASRTAIQHVLATLKATSATEQTIEATLRAAGAKVSFVPWSTGTVAAGTSAVDFFEAPITAALVIVRDAGNGQADKGAVAHCVAG
ncbi:hypothetical protein [Burkholderia cepacia]|uniref:hypothetical protein n=1 Tax=Burkholderia cepacia TaxID=292 RepID=UPI00075CECAF|nr:hypothetical protein [Burkholderia cepacia]KWF99087.1 hypothetical protein WL95_00285 [Burkholderia cepacia]